MKKNVLAAGLALMVSMPAMANLPDEINYSPYYDSYTSLRSDRDFTSNSLEESQEALGVILSSIDDKKNYLSVLNDEIISLENEISNLNQELPQVESYLRKSQSEIREVQIQLSKLEQRRQRIRRNLKKERQNLAPIKKEIQQKQKLVADVQKRIQNNKKVTQNKRAKVESQKTKINTNNNQISSLNKQIQNLNNSKVGLQNQIKNLKSEIQAIKSLITSQTNKVNSLIANQNKAKTKLAQDRAKLNQLIAANNNPAAIKAQKEIVRKSGLKVDAIGKRISSMRTELKKSRAKEKNKSVTLENTQKKLNAIPGQVAAKNQKKQKLASSNQVLKKSNQKLKDEVLSLLTQRDNLVAQRGNLEKRISKLANIRGQIREQIKILDGKLGNVNRQIASNEDLERGLSNRIADLYQRIDQINDRLPTLRQNVAFNDSEMAKTRKELRALESDEVQTIDKIARLERDLDRLKEETDRAYAQYTQRQDLYDNYKEQAQDIGSSQTNPAIALGVSAGESISDTLSTSLSQVVADDYGKAHAQLIGYVKGEIQGYKAGYKSGYADSASIDTATISARENSTEAAYNYAATHFAPKFFEQYMQEKLSSPVFRKSNKDLSSSTKSLLEGQKNFNKVTDLNQAEIDESMSLKTSMDNKITRAFSNVERVNTRLENTRAPYNIYQGPSSIPYQVANCQSVYKTLEHFKEICRDSYKDSFKAKFESAAYEKFADLYTDKFNAKFDSLEPVIRDNNIQGNFDLSEKVAFDEAEVIGKKDIYDETYSDVYSRNYDIQLPIARDLSDREAKLDVSKWIAANPIVTVKSSKYSQTSLRGGDSGVILIDLKNISPQGATTAAVVKVQRKDNIVLDKGQYVFSNLNGRAQKVFEIPFKVNSDAGSSDRIKFQAQVTLPGDKYQSARIEAIDLNQGLILNPKEATKLTYSKTPKVKGVFKFKIHSFKVNIAPAVESLRDGYVVTLNPIGPNASKIKMKSTKVKTSTLALNQSEEVSLKYSFPKSARGKQIDLELKITYKGLLLKKEIHSIKPR